MDMCMHQVYSTWSLMFIGTLLFITVPEDSSPLCQWRWSSWHCESVTWERSRPQHTWLGEWCVDHVWAANVSPWVPLNGDLICMCCFSDLHWRHKVWYSTLFIGITIIFVFSPYIWKLPSYFQLKLFGLFCSTNLNCTCKWKILVNKIKGLLKK